ncbi:MAG: hypothetical protein R3F01_08040 [Lysobacteraceae bacterium]
MDGIIQSFHGLLSRTDLVAEHSFSEGYDNGPFYNFTFGTEDPASLWLLIQNNIYLAPQHQTHMAVASMAMCSGKDGWQEYVQLHHWSPEVPVVTATDL